MPKGLAPPELLALGTCVRMVFKDDAAGLAVPLWMIDATADQPATPRRYPETHDKGSRDLGEAP